MRVGPRIWSHPDLQTRKARIWLFRTFVMAPIGLILAWLIFGNITAGVWERHEDREWGKFAINLSEIPRRYDRDKDNESAHELARLAELLGINFYEKAEDPEQHKALAAVHQAISDDLKRFVTDRPVKLDLSSTSQDYLNAHHDVITRVISLLIESPAPTWSRRVDDPVARAYQIDMKPPPLAMGYAGLSTAEQLNGPHKLAAVRLAKTLCAEAVRRESLGEHSGAILALRAEKQLEAEFSDSPYGLDRFLRIHLIRLRFRVLAQLESIPDDLIEWPDEELRKQFIISAATDVRLVRLTAQRFPSGRQKGAINFVVGNLFKPLNRLFGCAMSAKAREWLSNQLPTQDFDEEAYVEAGPLRAKKPNLLARIMGPSWFWEWRFQLRFQQEAELLKRIKMLRAATPRHANETWPKSFPELEVSFVPHAHWSYSVNKEARSVTMSFSDQHQWKGKWHDTLPLSHLEPVDSNGNLIRIPSPVLPAAHSNADSNSGAEASR